MNIVVLMGRLTKDPEARYTPVGKAITTYTLAVDRRFKKEDEADADFIQCVSFGKTAEFAGKYFKRGMRVTVRGRIQTGFYIDRNGRKVYTTDVIVEEQEFAQNKEKTSERPESYQGEDFVSVPDGLDLEIPFP